MERPYDRGTRIGRDALAAMGTELRGARVSRGLSQRSVASAARVSPSQVSRIERGLIGGASVLLVARLLAVVGLDLRVRAYPGGDGVRDAAHIALLERLHQRLPVGSSWSTEVPMPIRGDPRAWDALIHHAGQRIGVEAETRPTDTQALIRRVALKQRDGSVDAVVLLLADTRANRALLSRHGETLVAAFPLDNRATTTALERGNRLSSNGIALM